MVDCLLDGLIDSLKVAPWVFIAYIIIEFAERKVNFFKDGRVLKGKPAPLFGALLGAFPQCGISVMSAKLYEKSLIKLGTLLAVFIATSDEGLIILISNGRWLDVVYLLLSKIVTAVVVGYLVNLFMSKREQISDENADFAHEDICAHCHSGEHGHSHSKIPSWVTNYILVPLKHTLITFIFILIVNLAIGLIVYFVGEDRLSSFIAGTSFYQPFVVSLVGLIPNCASSVLITQLYVSGGITFGSLFAGLSVNAGIGFAILLKNTQKIKRNLIIIVSLYLLSSILGLLLTLIF